jgi:glycerol-3-phosphate dehydrogenase
MKRDLDALRGQSFDVLVIGGGITGAGIALDAVLRGFRVALVEKEDFASGTSSVSSKLVHGGLRYLEQGDFRLVYEALHERQLLLHNAPHLVHPLRFVVPFYAGARVPGWKFRVGLFLYDLLAGGDNIHRSRPRHRSELLHEQPGLRTQGLIGGAEYYDAQMDDARLCLEVVKTAAARGAVVANYTPVVGFERQERTISAVRLRDTLGGQEFAVKARQVVAAVGPWTDQLLRLAGDESGPYLKPTKGVHVIVPATVPCAYLLLHPRDGRVFFVLPWYAAGSTSVGRTLIGTTDTFGENPDALTVTPEDVAYLLDGYNQFLAPGLQAADVLGSFAGLRPLLQGRPGEPSSLSREFRLIESPSGLLAAAGGKYTTYRSMAEVITDAVARRLGEPRPGHTRHYRLDGAPVGKWERFRERETATLAAKYGIPMEAADHLVRRYGRRAADVAAYLASAPELTQTVLPGEPDLRVEFAYQRDHEMAIRPADFLLRRTRLGLLHPELLKDERVASLLAPGPVIGRGQ